MSEKRRLHVLVNLVSEFPGLFVLPRLWLHE